MRRPNVSVTVEGDLERALKHFKRRCEKDGVFADMRRIAAYEKPSVRRRRKQAMARRKARRRMKLTEEREAA